MHTHKLSRSNLRVDCRKYSICAVVSWASPHTAVRFYRLDVTATSVAHSVLTAGTGEITRQHVVYAIPRSVLGGLPWAVLFTTLGVGLGWDSIST